MLQPLLGSNVARRSAQIEAKRLGTRLGLESFSDVQPGAFLWLSPTCKKKVGRATL